MTTYKCRLSKDRRTLVVEYPVGAGILTATLTSRQLEGFSDEDVKKAIEFFPLHRDVEIGQRYITRRKVTRFGILWTHVMIGPPTWWAPRLKREKDGTYLAGWLRLAVGVMFERGKPAGVED